MCAARGGKRTLAKPVSLHYAALDGHSWARLERDWLPRLPAAKRARVDRLREPADRAATLLGIRLLDAALAARGVDDAVGRLLYPARGRPSLPGGPEFSISHARGLVACAIADDPIGLDLERRDAVRPTQLRLVLDADERAAVAGGALDATDAWVMKEAVLKAAGRGADAARTVTLHGRTAVLAGRTWHLHRVDLAGAHVAWLATPHVETDVVLHGPVGEGPAAR
jgi:phosphopantetheinyl transferase